MNGSVIPEHFLDELYFFLQIALAFLADVLFYDYGDVHFEGRPDRAHEVPAHLPHGQVVPTPFGPAQVNLRDPVPESFCQLPGLFLGNRVGMGNINAVSHIRMLVQDALRLGNRLCGLDSESPL